MPSFSLAWKNCTFFFFIIRFFLSYSVLVHCNCLPDRVIVWYHQFFCLCFRCWTDYIVQPQHSRLSSELRRDWCYSVWGGNKKKIPPFLTKWMDPKPKKKKSTKKNQRKHVFCGPFMIYWFFLVPAGFQCLSPFSLLLFSRKGFCSIMDFLVPLRSGRGFGACLPSSLFFFSQEKGSVP